MSEPECPQGERGARRAARRALAPAGLSEERTLSEPELVPVRDAATVVLLRDGDGGPEAYLLRRVRGMAFAAGMTVFPGGAVDPRDADAAVGWVGPPPAQWAPALRADEPLARALVCAAVRETFEESGVLLAGPSSDAVCETAGEAWEADRVALERREVSLAGLLERRGLVLRADLLRPWAHWITPVGEPRRYDTRFFVAALPAGQSTRDVTSEAEEAEWVRPADALDQARRGERRMMPPTVVTLEEVQPYGSVADVLEAARTREFATLAPELTEVGGVRVVTLPDGRVVRLGGLP
jgi:8-oxo-dGTP pyrophosphatase MutT (NUDIX family)